MSTAFNDYTRWLKKNISYHGRIFLGTGSIPVIGFPQKKGGDFLMIDIYEECKTNIRVSRNLHRLLKDLKKEDETFNDVLTKILKDGGYL